MKRMRINSLHYEFLRDVQPFLAAQLYNLVDSSHMVDSSHSIIIQLITYAPPGKSVIRAVSVSIQLVFVRVRVVFAVRDLAAARQVETRTAHSGQRLRSHSS